MTCLWKPRRALSEEEEERIIGRLRRVRKLLGFLRRHRHEIFDVGFQRELIEMYRQTGAGKPPVPPPPSWRWRYSCKAICKPQMRRWWS
jgi:hypothetical protein